MITVVLLPTEVAYVLSVLYVEAGEVVAVALPVPRDDVGAAVYVERTCCVYCGERCA